MADYSQDAFSIISEEIQKIEGEKKQTGDSIFICCPFHDENTPSCSINMSMSASVRLGTFYCFGCNATGGWNTLAGKLGLEKVKGWQHFEGSTSGKAERAKKKRVDLVGMSNMTIQRLFDEVGNAVLPWPKDMDWRSYSGKLINKVEGYMYDDKRFDQLMLVLPVYVNGRYRGGVRALQEKPKKGAAYFNTTGDWTKNYGLLGFDYIRKNKLWGCKAIVLVEGPRDWLRMAANKIPSCGILGSKMFSEKKLTILLGLGIEKIYVLPDNDKAGDGMAQIVAEFCKGKVECEHLQLPKKKDKDGKLIPLDPDNAPQKIVDKVKAIVYEHRQ